MDDNFLFFFYMSVVCFSKGVVQKSIERVEEGK